MAKVIPVESGFSFIDAKIKELGDWRGKTLVRVRSVVHEAGSSSSRLGKTVKINLAKQPTLGGNRLCRNAETWLLNAGA